MKIYFKIFPLAPGIAGLLGLALLISPWSPSTQTRGSFSLALDLDDSEGDQAVSSLDVSPGQVVPIQIFGSDIQNANGISARFGYDTTQVVYEGFDAGDVLPDAQALVEQDSTSVRIDVTSPGGSATVNAGWVGTARFRTTDAFSETDIRLVRAELARGGQSEVASPALGVALQLAAPPSPDFDGNGRVDFADFVLFAGAFGYREGDVQYEARYDLNGDGGIGLEDFVIFATSFGTTVNRAPVFASTPVTRSVVENSPAGQPIGSPITAADADGNALSYSLRGADADSFAIDASTGQLRTREGIAYDHEAKNRYSVTVRVSDGEGGRTIAVVGIAVTDADEPPSTPPSGVVVAPGDSALTVRWDAAHNEAGKPPVSGYEVAHLPAAQDSAQAGRPEDTGDWEEGRILNSRTDTSVTLTRLNNEQTYQVRVRTLNDEGASDWSAPVSGAPTAGSVTVQASNEPSLAVPWLYWTDARTGRIQRAELDGSDIRTLVSGLGQPRDLALDRDGGRMYWTDSGSDKIRRANLDGSRVEDLVTEGLKEPFGIALDVAGGKMYWTDYGTDKIQRANLDGSGVEDLVTGLNQPRGIALDLGDGRMYWTDWGTDKIQRANLDGSGVEDLVTGLNQPRGIALDLGDGRMYWTDWGTDKIQRANLDGSGVEDLVTSAGLLTPQAIALDAAGGKMYWTDYGTDKIQRANLDGSGVEDLVTSGLNEPYGLALGAGLPAQIFKAGGDSATLNLAGRFRDPDGGAVTLSVSSSDEAVATAALADSQVTIAPVAPGQITVAVTARDERGGTATLLVPVTVYPPNRPPVAQALADRKVRIDSLARVELSEAFTDPDVGDVLTYTATSSDEAVATAAVEGSGVNIAPKSPGQARISVTARDPEGLEASLSFGVTVEPKPPPPPPPPPPPRPPPRPRPPPPPPPRPPTTNQVPVFNEGASATRSVAENTPPDRNIGNPVGATDPEGRAVSYSLTGGDTDRFTIIPQNGQLRTRTGVDYNYEAQNRYSVRVEAQDEQGGRATLTVTIDITDDDNERPERPDQPTVTASTLTSLTIGWTAPANPGPPITDYNVRYREGSSGAFTAAAHDGARTATTIGNLKSNTTYQIQVQATSDEGTSQWSPSGNGRTVANQAPTFNEGSRTTRRVAENTTGTQNIGNPVTATDGDGGTLRYRLEGTDRASFAIDGNQLQTRAGETYDYEEKSSYEVTVRAEDDQGGSNTIEVTINLIDEREPPETPTAPSVSAASSTSLTVTWIEPVNTGPDIDDYDVQYREGDSGGFTPWTHNGAERTATITDLTPGTSYQVQVLARNAEGASSWSPSGTGSTGANGRPVFTDGSSATRRLDENTTGVQNIGDPVSATDPENTTLTYRLAGGDADAFTLDARSGQLRTDGDETYDYETKPRYVLSVKATDGHGRDRTIPVLINLNDVNEAPTFTSDAAFETGENNQSIGRVDAEDVDTGDRITGYTLTGGSDRDRFEINSGGVLTFKNDPNFEDPKDNGRNNEYIVVVTATGGTGGRALTAEQTITVTVEDVNEPPRFTSDNSLQVKENKRFVGRVAAEDVDSDDHITGYEVTGRVDRNRFEITNTNELHLKEDPDFERPADVGSNNQYIVAVTATGGTGTRERRTEQRITVLVEDDDEPPGKPDPPTVSDETENSLTVTWTEPANTGPDIANYHVQYRISGTFTDWPDTGPSLTRTITGLRSGRTYQTRVQAENDEGKGAWSNSVNGTTLTAPTVSRVAFTSTPASGQNSTYKLNDVIDITVTFSGAVAVTGTPRIDLTIGSTVRQADYQSGSTTTQLLFQYTVQNTDDDTDGATINANGLKLNGGRIRKNNSTINADLVHDALTNQSGHKVDGVAPALTEAEVKGDELMLAYEEVLDSSSQPATGDFAVTVDSEARSVSAVAVSSSAVTLTLASAVTSGQAVTLTYTPGTNPIRDRALNPAIALTNLTMANQTQDPTINICNRTAQVRDAIVETAPVNTCGAVTADHLSAITVLDLVSKGISTLKAGDFSGLSALEELKLSHNQLSSLPQNIFSSLSALEELKLSYSQLSSLNDADIFSSLSALKKLDLRGNGLRSLDANIFSSLSALEVLHLGDLNRLSSLDADIFSNLSALEELYLNGNELSSLDANIFSNLSALEFLDLNGNELSSLDANLFSSLSALKTLWLQENGLSTVASGAFSGLSALETLQLFRNELSSLDADMFSSLSALKTLRLEENDLSTVASDAFSGLTALETLYLFGNDLQPTSLPAGVFSSLTALETLRLEGNQLSSLPANFFSGLSALRELYLTGQQSGHRLNSLDANTFSGLAALTRLHLNDNNLSSLPDGVFSGMTELEALILAGNTVDPLPITVSLESLASGLFRAKAHTGAPFEMTLPLQVVNGTIGSGAGSIEIPQGSIQSAILTVSRTAGTTAAVTVDIGTLPDLPSYDNGYALVKSTDLPLEVIEGLPGVTVYPTALTIPEGNSDTYIVVLQLQPTEDVTVAVTVPGGSDASVNPASLTFTEDNWDDSQTVTVTTQADTDDADDTVTLSHAASGGNYEGVTAENVTVTIAEVDVSANNRPVFTSDDIFDKKENETEVGTVVATDADARDPITGYEITGGAAQALFSITSGGVLTFATAPDYERPAATASNSRYVVAVTATSGTGTRERTATQPITVVVDDVDEPPGQPPAPILTVFDSGFQPVVLVHEGRTPPTNTGPDITAWDIQYNVKNSGAFTATILNKPPGWVQEITGLFRNTTYEVRLRAKNDEGESEWSPSSEATIPNASPIASGSIDDLTMPAGGAVAVVSVEDAFDDPDDTRLRYAATSSNGAIATVQVIGGVVLIDPLSAGTATITATATDPWGATASTTFDANVQTPTLAAPTLSISGNLFSFGFTDAFAANETRFYEVRIRQKANIGPWAAACINATNKADVPRNIAASRDILASSFFEPGATYEADYGYLGTDCGGSVVGVRSAPAEATTTGTPSFDIDLVFVGSISSRYQLAVEAAARRWEQIITHDVPNHPLSDNTRSLLNELYPGITVPDNVDDLMIYVKIAPIDGAGGTLGQAGSDVWRVPSALPIVSFIELDASDLDTMSDQLLAGLILHEIGHTLGFGIDPWTDHNLLQNPSLGVYNNRVFPAPDTHFSGTNAIAAFNAAGGTSYTGAKVPVENTLGGSGSQDSHWRESILDNELMTPSIGGAVHPLSAITIQSLADIGYRVDAAQADAYMAPDASTRVATASAGDPVPIRCAIITHPGAGPDRPEPIVLEVKPPGN